MERQGERGGSNRAPNPPQQLSGERPETPTPRGRGQSTNGETPTPRGRGGGDAVEEALYYVEPLT